MSRPVNLRKEAERIALEHHLPPAVFKSLVFAESQWNVNAKSPVGAQGLTQLMPATAKSLGVDPHDPIQALEGGARYLKAQLDRFGSMRLALAAYNAGPGAVESGAWRGYGETTRYVTKIMDMARTPAMHDPPKNLAAPAPLATSTPLTRPSSMIGPPQLTTSSLDPAKVAFDNLSDIGRGGSPTRGLSRLVDSVQAAAAAPPVPDPAPAPLPDAPSTQGLTAPRGKSDGSAPGKLPLAPGGGWDGSHDVVKGFAAIATALGLQSTSEKRDTKMTKSGNTSDHWNGNKNAYAEDLSNGYATPEMDQAAEHIAATLGVKWTPRQGPLELTKIVDGYRIQVLYRTQTGGDHFTHIHVGARRVS